MTKHQIQQEFGVCILLHPSEANRELSESEEIEYRKFMQIHRDAFNDYFSDDYQDTDIEL